MSGDRSRWTTASIGALVLASGLAAVARIPGALAQGAGTPADAGPAFAAPPGDESPAMRGLIDKAKILLDAGMTPDRLLTDPHYLPAHEHPRFRDLIRGHASSHRATIVTPDEPGQPLIAGGTIRGKDGRPVKGALIYVYQTSATGWYAAGAPHYSGSSGDEKHARLFGYMTTDAGGAYELHTIHPAGYPDRDLPAHIHVEVTPPGAGAAVLVTEIRFDDDPRMTPAMRERSEQEGYLVRAVTRDAHGDLHVTADFSLR